LTAPVNHGLLDRFQEPNTRKALVALALLNSLPLHADQSASWLQQYLAIGTVNPPRDESRGLAFLANIIEEAGIRFETTELTGVHGNNEQFFMDNLKRGTKIMTDFLFEFATDKSSGKLRAF
jgi:hypothetical protein